MRERIEREIACGWSLYLAENEAGELLGFLALKPESKCLDQIFVAPARSGRGSVRLCSVFQATDAWGVLAADRG